MRPLKLKDLEGVGGDDAIYGHVEYDTIAVGAGSDLVLGGTRADTLRGGDGNNLLYGEEGVNQLVGDRGNDPPTGGAGNDVFVFNTTLNNTSDKDGVADFSAGQNQIQMSKAIFIKLTTLGALTSSGFKASSTRKAGDSNDYILYNTTTGALAHDADGCGSGMAVQFATLTNKLQNLSANDFLVVS